MVKAWVTWLRSPLSAMTAMPKSARAGSPYADSKTLAGFTSRWRIPLVWANSSAPARATPVASVSVMLNGPAICRRSARVPFP